MSVWDDDANVCVWVVDDETDDDEDRNSANSIYVVEGDARCFPLSAGESDGDSSESEAEGAQNMSAKSEFDDEEGNLATAAEVESGPIYPSPLSAPPNRQMSAASTKSSDP